MLFASIDEIIDGTAKPMTNADRIRAMSDEELAKWVLQFVVDCIEETLAEECRFEDGSEANMLLWLQQPAKENDNG